MECSISIEGVSPSVLMMLHKAAAIATEHDRDHIDIGDITAAVLTWDASGWSDLDAAWPRPGFELDLSDPQCFEAKRAAGQAALTYDQLRELVLSMVPGSRHKLRDAPVRVTHEIVGDGPYASEFRQRMRQ